MLKANHGIFASSIETNVPFMLFRGFTRSLTTTSASSAVVLAPPGIVAGDTIIITAGVSGNTFTHAAAGFTKHLTISGSGSCAIFSKIATASEPASYTITWSFNREHNINCGVYGGGYDYIFQDNSGGGGGNPNPDDVPCQPNDLILSTSIGSGPGVIGIPSNMSETNNNNSNSTSGSCILSDAHAQATGIVFAPNSPTDSVGSWRSVTTVWRPV